MTSAKEYREFAKECLRWAESTRNPEHKQALTDMARLWAQTALEVEQAQAVLDDKPLPKPSATS